MKTNYLNVEIEIDDLCPIYRGSFGLNGELAEPESIAEVVSILRKIKNPVLLDVGACTGSYALLDKLVNVSVHSFEPVARTFKVLKNNIRMNNSKTKAYNIAVSNYDGLGILKTVYADGAVALSIVDGMPSRITRKSTVKSTINIVTLDVWCEKNNIIPNFIKIDTEGGELRVLQGAQNIIEKYKPAILCEYCQENANQFGYNIGEIIKFLKGYTIQHLGANILCYTK